MPIYKVCCTLPVLATITVEAEDEEAALEEASSLAWLNNYVGNGGRGDKLVGTTEKCVSLEAPQDGWIEDGAYAPVVYLSEDDS